MDNLTLAVQGTDPAAAPTIHLGGWTTGVSIPVVLRQAFEHYQAGRLPEAEKLYEAVVQAEPKHAEAHHNLGVLAVQQGKPEAGLPHFKTAWETDPACGQYWLSFVDCLIKAGQWDDARRVLAVGRDHGLAGPVVDQLQRALTEHRETDAAQERRPSNEARPSAAAVTASAGTPRQDTGERQGPKTSKRGKRAKARRARLPVPSAARVSPRADREAVVRLFDAGQLSEAELSARDLTRRFPDDGLAWKILGTVLAQQGHYESAQPALQAAVQRLPRDAEVHNALGVVFRELGRADEAIASYQRAVTINPDFAPAHYNLGNAETDLGRREEAVASYRRAIASRPEYTVAHYNLGRVQQDLGHLDEAQASYQRVLAIQADHVEAHNNLGTVLADQGRPNEAIDHYRRAVASQPNYVDAHFNLSKALKQLGRLEEAVDGYRWAVQLKPDLAEAHNNLGSCLQDLGYLNDALASCQQALAIRPDYADAYNNLGSVLCELGRVDEAKACLHKALTIEPEHANAHGNLGNVLRDLGRLHEAAHSYRRAFAIQPDNLVHRSNLLYLYAFTRVGSFQQELEEARQWEQAALSAAERETARHRVFENPEGAGRPLRLGIVSAELGAHAVSYFLSSFLGARDRARLTVLLYPTTLRREAETAPLRALADQWTPLWGVSDTEAAARIRGDGVDVLLDTTGHTQNCRLGVFAHRAAPVQCHYLGYAGTTGLTEMDYFLADEVLIPRALDPYFQETVWRLPRPWAAYTPLAAAPEPQWRPTADGRIRLGSFNNLNKLSDACLSLWARVLRALPEATLLLKDKLALDRAVQGRIVDTLVGHGIARERVTFLPRTPDWRSHMAQYDQLDVALDTLPFGSGTTGFDAMWMGAPLITLAGVWLGGRMSASLLTGLGHSEWIAETEDAYVEKVVTLARDRERRAQLRGTQRARLQASPLCDGAGLARALETAFETMFDRWWTTRDQPERTQRPVGVPAITDVASPSRTITPRSAKLHLGCGKRHIPGYYHVDLLSAPHVDLCHRVEVLPFADNSVGLIYASHVLEHFGRKEVEGVLREWYRVLWPGGLVRLAVPDFEAVVEMYATEGLRDGYSGLVGLVSGGQRNEYDFHKIIFDEPFLSSLLRKIGFRNVRRWDWRGTDHASIDDYSQAYLPHMDKEHGRLMSLNIEADK